MLLVEFYEFNNNAEYLCYILISKRFTLIRVAMFGLVRVATKNAARCATHREMFQSAIRYLFKWLSCHLYPWMLVCVVADSLVWLQLSVCAEIAMKCVSTQHVLLYVMQHDAWRTYARMG